MAAISQRVVEALEAGETDRFVWDDRLDGFGVRVYPSGRKKFLIQWKREGRTRRLVLGSHPLMKAERARRLAIDTLAAVSRGEDPAAERDHCKASPTVAALCASWLALGSGPTGKSKRASTLGMDRSRIEAHVVPVIGALKVRSVTAAHIRALVEKIVTGATAVDESIEGRPRARRIVKGGPGVAHRTLRMVAAIFAHAVRTGLIAKNPAQHVRGGSERERERFLSPAEMHRLCAALDAAEATGAAWQAMAAIRLILATGLRRNEALALRWSEVDFDGRRLILDGTKTGRSIRPLSRAAIAILAGIRDRAGNGWVFPASRGTAHYLGLQRVWAKARAEAELGDVRIHDLRHTFAAGAAMSGASLLTVGRMLGHAKARSSERYSHLADDYLSDAADRAAEVLDLDMGRKSRSAT